MSQLTLIPLQQNQYPRNARQRAEMEDEIAEVLCEKMIDEEEAQEYLKDSRQGRFFYVKIRIEDMNLGEWNTAFKNTKSIESVSKHLAKRCKRWLAA